MMVRVRMGCEEEERVDGRETKWFDTRRNEKEIRRSAEGDARNDHIKIYRG